MVVVLVLVLVMSSRCFKVELLMVLAMVLTVMMMTPMVSSMANHLPPSLAALLVAAALGTEVARSQPEQRSQIVHTVVQLAQARGRLASSGALTAAGAAACRRVRWNSFSTGNAIFNSRCNFAHLRTDDDRAAALFSCLCPGRGGR